MRPRCYIGNIPYTTTDEEIRKHFANYTIKEVKIITDRDTGRPRGFAFIELGSPAEVQEAIKNLNGSDLGGRQLTISEAHEPPQRGGGGGGGRGGGDRGGGRGRDNYRSRGGRGREDDDRGNSY